MGIAKPRRRIGRPPLVKPNDSQVASPIDRRTECLEAATTVFLEHGYERTTLSQIIDRVGGSNRTLYAMFGDKAGLFSAVVEHVFSKKMTRLSVLQDMQGDFAEALLIFGQQISRHANSPVALKLHRILVASMDRFPDIGLKTYNAVAVPTEAILAEFFEYHSRHYIYRLKSHDDMAKLFVAIMQRDFSARVMKAIDGQLSEEELDAFASDGVGFFLAGAVIGKRDAE